MQKFTPILLETDTTKINQFKRESKAKLELYYSLLEEATTMIEPITQQSTGSFLKQPLQHLEQAIIKANPIDLPISTDKLLFLLEIDTTRFKEILKEYNSNPVKLHYKDWKVEVVEIENLGETYTKTLEQNVKYKEAIEMLDAYKAFFDVEVKQPTIHGSGKNYSKLQQLQKIVPEAFKLGNGNLTPSAYYILQH